MPISGLFPSRRVARFEAIRKDCLAIVKDRQSQIPGRPGVPFGNDDLIQRPGGRVGADFDWQRRIAGIDDHEAVAAIRRVDIPAEYLDSATEIRIEVTYLERRGGVHQYR